MQVAQEALAALRTVQLFNAIPHEEKKFSDRVDHVLNLPAMKQSRATSSSVALAGARMSHY
jgi:hypothetical protein